MLKSHTTRAFAFAIFIPLLLHLTTTDLSPAAHFGQASAQQKLNKNNPKVVAAVANGLKYLKSVGTQSPTAYRSLAAATAMKAGVVADEPWVKAEIDRILVKFKEGYSEKASNYEPAVDLMSLCEARRFESENRKNPNAYRNEIQTLINFLISKQNSTGDWDYYGRPIGEGDTSQTQFAILGLWSATEVGFAVPIGVWENAATWLLETQFPDGGFSYHPKGPRDHGEEHGTTVAGVSALLIIRFHLYSSKGVSLEKVNADSEQVEKTPNAKENPFQRGRRDETEPVRAKRDGVVEPLKVARPARRPSISHATLTAAIMKGVDWLTRDYRMDKVERWDLYYRYGVERMTALLDVESLDGHDWYTDGAQLFLDEQDEDGSWGRLTLDGQHAGTCFAILFLTRATRKTFEQQLSPQRTIPGGQARGFKDNPRMMTADGDVKIPATGPLEELLADLIRDPQSAEAPKRAELLAAKLLQEIRGNPEKIRELIGQKDELKRLAELPNDDARIAALWALGRCEDLSLAPLMLKAIADDNIDVSTAARDALCMLSRRPQGDGLLRHPWANLPDDATEEIKAEAFLHWRTDALNRWKQWYARIRPYDQRDDLSDAGTGPGKS